MKGLEEFRAAFENISRRGREEISDGLREHLEEVVKPQADVLVPKLTEALAQTGRVVPGAARDSWQLRYGNSPVSNTAEVDYAAAVHERDDVAHLPPTSAHFVERPLRDTAGQIPRRVGKKLEDLAEGG